MKILFVTPLYPPEIGGPATYAKLLMEELPKRGIRVTLVKFSDFKTFPSGIRHLALFFKLLFSSFSHDVIFAQDVFSVGFPGALVAKITGKPLVVRVPGDYAWEQGVQRFGVQESIDMFQITKYSWQVELLRNVQKFVVRSAARVIAPSLYFANVVQTWLPINSKKVIPVYNGIDTEKILAYQKKEYLVGETKTIVASGRLVPWKEFGSLIKLIARHASWKLVLVGEGPELQYLKKLAKSLQVITRVHFKGVMSQQKLWETISHADVFVLNSSFESFSYQAVEAMMIGVPVVTTDACNMQEIVKNEESGIIVPSKNDEELERALVQLLSNQAMRENIGHGGIKKARDFGVSVTIDRLIKIFHETLN